MEIRKKMMTCFLCMMLFVSILPLVTAQGETLVVDIQGSGDYTSIQQAIDSARPGDEIVVLPGRYDECLVLDVSLELRSRDDANTTFVDGGLVGQVLQVIADGCVISGFTFCRPGDVPDERVGMVTINGDYCTFSHNVVSMNESESRDHAIAVSGRHDTIHDCRVVEDESRLLCAAVQICAGATDTNVYFCALSGMYYGVHVERETQDTVIHHCAIHDNSLGLSIFEGTAVTENHISNNTAGAIHVSDGAGTLIRGNVIVDNEGEYVYSPVYVYSSAEHTIVSDNYISSPFIYGLYLNDCFDTVVTGNDFMGQGVYLYRYLDHLFRNIELSGNYYSMNKKNNFGWQEIDSSLHILSYFDAVWEIPWFAFEKTPVDEPNIVFR